MFTIKLGLLDRDGGYLAIVHNDPLVNGLQSHGWRVVRRWAADPVTRRSIELPIL